MNWTHRRRTERDGRKIGKSRSCRFPRQCCVFLTATVFLCKRCRETKQVGEKLAGRIDAKIRALKIKIREEKRRYEALLEGNGRESCTPGEFNDQLVALSKHAGFRLTPDISLAEYAGYLKDYKNTLRYDKRSK